MKYPKINSLWKRYDQEGKNIGSLIEGDYACSEFALIKKWSVYEKIDGTNIRIHYDNGSIDIFGRNEDSGIPEKVIQYIQENLINNGKIEEEFKSDKEQNIWLFGEGYGPTIQSCGGNYRKDVGFILFDCFANGRWLLQSELEDIASRLGLPVAPFIADMTDKEIVSYIKSHPMSLISRNPQVMEGVVAKCGLQTRHREPVMFKLKCKEYQKEEVVVPLEKISNDNLQELLYELNSYPKLYASLLKSLDIKELADMPKAKYRQYIEMIKRHKIALSDSPEKDW